ncbi:MAG: hypothetical protein ABSG68_00845 [Thermoguttaceae bacterium]|jgi:hypothetical protein
MRYTLTWLSKENAFRVRREDGEVAHVPAAMFRKLAGSAMGLRSTMNQAVRKAGEPVRFEYGKPAECAENYQRSLVRAGSADAASLRLKKS